MSNKYSTKRMYISFIVIFLVFLAIMVASWVFKIDWSRLAWWN